MTLSLSVVNLGSKRWQLGITSAFFVVWVGALFIAFGGSGWHPTDYEHIPAFSYRLAQGDVPYRDFIYHKPPGTLFLHMFWLLLPDSIEVRASRLFVYSQMAASTLVPIGWALHRSQVKFGWRLGLLGCATTAIALHNFPIMPWQTIDGLFFGILGWVAFLESTLAEGRRALVTRGLASFLIGYSLLCKQSFILTAGAFALYSGAEAVCLFWRGGRAALKQSGLRLAVSALPAMLIGGSFWLWLTLTGAWPHFVAQFVSQSTSGALWDTLTWLYRDWNYIWIVLPWALVPALRLIDGPGIQGFGARVVALWPLGLLGQAVFQLSGDATMHLGPAVTAALVGMLIGQCLLLVASLAVPNLRTALSPRMVLLTIGVVTIALGCQLSLGYATPILGLGAFGLVLHASLPDERWPAIELWPVLAVSYLTLTTMWKLNEVPYRDGARPTLTRDMGELFPRLSGIHTTPQNFERYASLKQIVTEQVLPTGRRFAMLQDYPGAHWLFGTHNPYGIDWDWPPDTGGFEPRLIEELEKTNPIAVIPKESDAGWGERLQGNDTPCAQLNWGRHAPVSQYVLRSWRLIGENRYFCLFSR